MRSAKLKRGLMCTRKQGMRLRRQTSATRISQPTVGALASCGARLAQTRRMRRPLVLATSLLIFVAAEALAQSSEQDTTIRELRNQLEDMRSQMVNMQNRIATLEAAQRIIEVRSQPEETKTAGEPTTFHFKGLTLTPGGFLNSTALVRARNENADVSTSYSATPLDGSSNAHLSELRGTARNSQLSLMLQGAAGNTRLRGYVEIDFLGAAPTANYVQSSSWSPRLRQLWIQIERPSGLTISAGQMWSLLTTNRQGMANLQELKPGGEDANFVAGFTWTRERAVRVTQNFNNRVWVGVALENPESTYAAAFVPPNVMGLNTSPNAATGVNLLPFLANYSTGHSTTLAPDLVAKLDYEPSWGHVEIKALGRLFRDRIAATATTSGRTHTTDGYGIGFGALIPVAGKRLELSLEGWPVAALAATARPDSPTSHWIRRPEKCVRCARRG